MEAAKKGSFFKGKFAKSFARVTKPRATSHEQCGSTGSSSSKVVPCSQSISNGSSSSPGAFTGQILSNYSSVSRVSNYSYASSKQPTNVANLPSSTQKVSYARFKPPSFYDQNDYANDTWGYGDDNVDSRATSFISTVRERFNLD